MSHHHKLDASFQHGDGAYATLVAAFSFLTGAALYTGYRLDQTLEIALVRSLFVCAAILVNALVLLHLLYLFASKKADRELTGIRILIVLSNIPIAYYLLHNL